MILEVLIQAGEVNMTAFPTQLAEKLMITDFSANILASLIVIMMFVIPTAIVSKADFIVTLLAFFISVFFCVAMSWLDTWIVLFVSLFTVALFSFGPVKKALGG